MKYVGFDITTGPVTRRIVVAFPSELVHADMAAGVEPALRLSCPQAKVALRTAGDMEVTARYTGGKSTSLELEGSADDAAAFNGADYGQHMTWRR